MQLVRYEPSSSRQGRVGASLPGCPSRALPNVSDRQRSFLPSALIHGSVSTMCGCFNLQITGSFAGTSRCVTTYSRWFPGHGNSVTTNSSTNQRTNKFNNIVLTRLAKYGVHDSFSLSERSLAASSGLPPLFADASKPRNSDLQLAYIASATAGNGRRSWSANTMSWR